ncbi:DUF6498-containing protein [archaeon]|nr:DUF6498-containing protein [archaeon]
MVWLIDLINLIFGLFIMLLMFIPTAMIAVFFIQFMSALALKKPTKEETEKKGIKKFFKKDWKIIPDVTKKDIKRVIKKPSGISLIVANLVILISAVSIFNTLWAFLLIYWMESAMIGFYHVLKMLLVKGGSQLRDNKFVMIPAFIFLFGYYMANLLLWVFAILISTAEIPDMTQVFSILLGVGLLFLSHGISFYTNFLKKKEYEKKTLREIMFTPFRRTIVMQLSIGLLYLLVIPLAAIMIKLVEILFITFELMPKENFEILGAQIILYFVAAVIITGKTLIDLASHAAERKRFGSL